MWNDRLAYDYYEMIEGKKFMLASPNRRHAYIMSNIFVRLYLYLEENNVGRVFSDNMDVHLPDGNLVMPDVCVVCDKEAFKRGSTVYGVPDFVVEILSYSTRRYDTAKKKDIYEKNGVKEYWIVNPWDKSVSVNILRDGKFELDNIYTLLTEEEFAELNDEEKAEIKTEIKLSIFEDFTISVKNIFSRIED
ncbi:MAG: Uma2 family endonuclease [Selenomonadaceae bacterium]|nr:Uma2 family endonuclease [Selenomonadaceae bacterium]